jgi:rsbT co-antagonist protein RsbR
MVQTPEELQAENEQLRQRVAELERERDEARDDHQWMEDLLEQSNIPICLWRGDDHIYQFANTAYLLGSGKQDAIGKPIHEVFEEYEIPGLLAILDHVYASGNVHVVSEALVRLNNPTTGVLEDRWFNLVYNPVRNAEGEVLGVSNFAIEVTEQVRARQELHQQAQILNQVRGSVIVTDMQGTIISWNRDSTRIYGYTAEEAVGQPITIIYPPDRHEWVSNEIIAPLQAKGAHETESIVWNKAGKRFMIQISLSLLHNDNGTPVGMIGHSIDISKRKEQEEELLIFKAMIENAPDGFALASMDGNLRYLNPAYYGTLGYNSEELLGQPIVNHLESDPEYIANLIQQVADKGMWQGELLYKHAHGTFVHGQASSFITFDSTGQPLGLCGIFRDITEQKQAEAERAALQQQVIEAQRATLRELSAPLLPISAGVVIMPLIGTVDSQRAQQIMETLLEGVATHHANIAIVDITGVHVVDTQVANALMQAAQAVRLLGSQVVLTGIGPAMAQTLVSLGVDLSSIITRGNLQGGIAYALRTSRSSGLKSGE